MEAHSKKVELIGVSRHPTNSSWEPGDYAPSGAMGCFSEKCSADIHNDHKVVGIPYGTRKLNWKQTRELIMRETSGRGHGAVLDQETFIYSIDNLTRASTLFLCAPEYASHVQQSLRRATAERGFLESNAEGNELMKKQFYLYEKMMAAGLPTEDSRIILPLNTKTAIQTSWSARELMHLEAMASDPRQLLPSDVLDTVKTMYELAEQQAPELMKNRGFNMERLSFFPSSQLFYSENAPLERLADEEPGARLRGYSLGIRMTEEEIKKAIEERDEALLADLKHYHFSFVAPISLMTFHQATRQRTWNQSVETLAHAVQRGKYITPKCIRDSEFKDEFDKLTKESVEYVKRNPSNGENYGVVPHALEVYDLIHVNGWNALHAIGKRRCRTAQWEIRDIAKLMASKIEELAPELGKYSLPQGVLYGHCPERENCGACRK